MYSDKHYQQWRHRYLYHGYVAKDKKRWQETDITPLYVKEMIQSECAYCWSKNQIGLDRIDNNVGHTIENCIPCCSICNGVRSNIFTYQEMKIIWQTLKKLLKKRKN
jgi:hypothetical protein